MLPLTHFYMIRHGETEANARQIMAGSLDSPLTETGRKQAVLARVVVERLEIRPTRIVHSHLSRARDTAAIINENLGLPMVEDPDLAEIHVGELEGAPYERCMGLLDKWADSPGGETCGQFFERVRRAKKKTLENPDGPALIVSHGGVFRALWKMYGHDMPGVRNCHLHEFRPDPSRRRFPWITHVYDFGDSLVRTEALYHQDEEIV